MVDAPKRHVSSSVSKQIKRNEDPAVIFPNARERRRRDTDARYTKKNDQYYYGYKAHTKVCYLTKLIIKLLVTPAGMHDSQAVYQLISGEDRHLAVLGDSAYNGKPQTDYLSNLGITCLFMTKRSKITKALSSESKHIREQGKKDAEMDRKIAGLRARIEHVFGYIETVFGGSFVRCCSLARVKAHQWLTACGYNALRAAFLTGH